MNLQIGDPWPFASCRSLTGRPCEPVWHALLVAPQKEARKADLLIRAGVEVVYPTKIITRHIKGRRVEYVRPLLSRLIYARFTRAPNWFEIFERRVAQQVMIMGSDPIRLTAQDVARVMGLPDEERRLMAEKIEAARFKPGDDAEIVEGPLKGHAINVTRSEAGRVWYDMVTGVGVVKGEAPESMLKKVDA